ncbi:MAG: flagellar hook-associated protein FlgK [Planktotalea sp.]|uniref:flagellar hook-associated protein FlgK n=1 Tax=Planktotalea sp. TaxID=2029877 RepID=UPI003C754318
MSLSSSLSNALSGLSVTSRTAQLVSSNLANALNEGYARREIELGGAQGGGVFVSGINRFVDAALLSDRRNAQSSLALSSERARVTDTLEQVIGLPDDPYSISAHLNQFDASLRFLESEPNSEVRLRDTLATASVLSRRLNASQNHIQAERLAADRQIATGVETLNTSLQQIAMLNERIVSANVNGRDANTLLDERQTLIDQVSELVPVREMPRAQGAVSLVTGNGMMLIENSAVTFEFTRTNQILPHMSIENAQLNALELDGEKLDLGSNTGPLSGGRLQALFQVRDTIAPDAQDRVDAFALDLAGRFHDLPGDLGTVAGAPGLFTDDGARVDVSDQLGLAGRLEINALADPAQGGNLWRLRSGMNAPSEAAAGYSSFVTDMVASLAQQSPLQGSVFDHSASLISTASQVSSSFAQEQSFASARYEQLDLLQMQNGVDTDAELQKLLLIETNYAANAKVIQTIDEMLATIMRIN